MFLAKYESHIYAVLRIAAGFLFLCHGTQKLFDCPVSEMKMAGLMPWISGGIEFAAGLLIMIGFLTRWAAFIASGEMAVAYWSVHGLTAVLPLVNHGELAFIYCFMFLFIAAHGSGIFSIDQLMKKPRI